MSVLANYLRPILKKPRDKAEGSTKPDRAMRVPPTDLEALVINEDRDRKPSPEGDKQSALRPDIHVTRQTPPTFLRQAENDYVDGVNQSLVYYIALKNAEVPGPDAEYGENLFPKIQH